ncbi:hypothetical protein BS17DRAFT_805109 [Gyrodon lividus]|nr:hypothetical protein BS17DRAFT_805109 [Gyrodon lividus]
MHEDDSCGTAQAEAGNIVKEHLLPCKVPNPKGKNQHKDCSSKDDPRINRLLSIQMLQAEHGIHMSEATVSRWRKDLGLMGSSKITCSLPESMKRQLVLDQLAQDPLSRHGPRLVWEAIVAETGFLLTSKKVSREPLVSLGPYHEWSGDGHDKLSEIGFPIWAIRDKWSGKWLGIWVVPNNRLKTTISYLYLSLVYELGGMPLQTTTDCGSETIEVYGFANVLRKYFSPNLSTDDLPAHRFLRSVHNITIECGWLCLRLQWGDNVKVFWVAGEEIYNEMDLRQYDLIKWLWLKLIQQELDKLQHQLNTHTVWHNHNK